MHKRPVVAKTLAAALGETASRTIWRSVVFAGAMLGSAACGGGNSKGAQEPAPTPVVNQADPATPAADGTLGPAATEEERQKSIQDARDAGILAPAPPAPDAAATTNATADPCDGGEATPADPAADPAVAATPDPDADKPATKTKTKRPRGHHKSRPTGRGFILS